MIDPINPNFTNTPASTQRPDFDYALADIETQPYVSIVTAFHNTGSIFHETARSVLQQSFQQWEWLIINDGSTDPEALAILETYRHGDPRIQVIDQPTNKGLSTARNIGFQAAQTEYILQLDSDDLLEPTAIEKWLWFLESYPEYAFCKGHSVGFEAEHYLWNKGFHSGDAFLDENQVDVTSLIRKTVHQAVGGYDEADRGGLMDWDFWLRCANKGYWGDTVPEYLNWYRRRSDHHERWSDFDRGKRQQAYQAKLRQKYSRLWDEGFPKIQPMPRPQGILPDELPCENRLQKNKPRLLLLAPWMAMGGADKFNLDLLHQLTQQGWEMTIATTLEADHPWLPEFARYTPDVFILHHFLHLTDYPRFLRYLIYSRQVDVVLISNSRFGYLLLPYLRAHFPEVIFVDFCHMEEERRESDDMSSQIGALQTIEEGYRQDGGYPRQAIETQTLLDLNIVASEHLKGWMTQRGADPDRVAVSYINVDTEEWQPNPKQRSVVRQELDLDDATPLILYVARMCAQKQPRVFAQTMLHLRQQGLTFTTVAAGGGPEYEWLCNFVEENKLNDQLHLLGAVSNQRVKQLMMGADIFFLPSEWEGIALSIYEAMACGLPIIGADVGGQRELVTPDCGVLITRSDETIEVQQYVEILTELLNNPHKCQEMGQVGRTRVSTHFHLEQMGQRMETLIQQAGHLGISRPRPRVGVALGRVCAAQAVEYTRLFQKSESVFREQQAWIRNREEARSWWEKHASHWQQVAEEREQIIQEQRTWINNKEEVKPWWEEQASHWQQVAEEREQIIQEQRTWINELEKGKSWWEEQASHWQQIAEEREQIIQEQPKMLTTLWSRLRSAMELLK